MRRTALLLACSALTACATAPALAAPVQPLRVVSTTVTEGGVASVVVERVGASNRQTASFAFETVDGTAMRDEDYTSRAGNASVAKNASRITLTFRTIDDDRHEEPEQFNVRFRATRGASFAEPLATIAVTDNDAAPPPVPPVEPPHHDTGGWVMNPTPSVIGTVPVVAADAAMDVRKHLKPSWYGGEAPLDVTDGTGNFRFICTAGQVARADPGARFGGRSHLHQFFGLMNVTPTDTYETLRTKEANSTCNQISPEDWALGVRPLNKTAYWLAAMLDGTPVGDTGKTADGRTVMVVVPDYASNYYKRGPDGSVACVSTTGPYAGQTCAGLPDAFRMIAGYDMQSGTVKQRQAWYFDCDGPTARGGHYPTMAEAVANCPYDPAKPSNQQNRLGIVVQFPTCWNGRDLDSADHMSHVVYTELDNNYGTWVCPFPFKVVIPSITEGIWYTVDANTAQWRLSSDIDLGKPAGSTVHLYYFGAWHPAALATVNRKCIGEGRNSSGGDLCDGTQLPGAQANGENRANPRLIPIPAD